MSSDLNKEVILKFLSKKDVVDTKSDISFEDYRKLVREKKEIIESKRHTIYFNGEDEKSFKKATNRLSDLIMVNGFELNYLIALGIDNNYITNNSRLISTKPGLQINMKDFAFSAVASFFYNTAYISYDNVETIYYKVYLDGDSYGHDIAELKSLEYKLNQLDQNSSHKREKYTLRIEGNVVSNISDNPYNPEYAKIIYLHRHWQKTDTTLDFTDSNISNIRLEKIKYKIKYKQYSSWELQQTEVNETKLKKISDILNKEKKIAIYKYSSYRSIDFSINYVWHTNALEPDFYYLHEVKRIFHYVFEFDLTFINNQVEAANQTSINVQKDLITQEINALKQDIKNKYVL